MRAIKKLNNNVALCVDGNGKELIAFGKGIGFSAMPYEITDLSTVERTFYDISERYLGQIATLPDEVVEFTSRAVIYAAARLDYALSPNLLLTLADHIAFAIERERLGLYVRMPLAYEVAHAYPNEYRIADYILQKINERFRVRLQRAEISGIAMAFVCAQLTADKEAHKSHKGYTELLDDVTFIIETELGITVDRDSFNYARFATHMQYLLQRLEAGNGIESDNARLYQALREECVEVSLCADKIAARIKEDMGHHLTDEEEMYLVMHINRIYAKGE